MIGSLHTCRNALDQGGCGARTRVTISVEALESDLAALIARTLRDGYEMVLPSATTSRAGVDQEAHHRYKPSIGGA